MDPMNTLGNGESIERSSSGLIQAGTPAPDFELHTTPDQTIRLGDLRGRPVVLAFIGHQPSIGVEWQIGRHTTVNVVYSHFFTGDFIEASGASDDIDFVAASVQYRF
jgi:hypothetical protein